MQMETCSQQNSIKTKNIHFNLLHKKVSDAPILPENFKKVYFEFLYSELSTECTLMVLFDLLYFKKYFFHVVSSVSQVAEVKIYCILSFLTAFAPIKELHVVFSPSC